MATPAGPPQADWSTRLGGYAEMCNNDSNRDFIVALCNGVAQLHAGNKAEVGPIVWKLLCDDNNRDTLVLVTAGWSMAVREADMVAVRAAFGERIIEQYCQLNAEIDGQRGAFCVRFTTAEGELRARADASGRSQFLGRVPPPRPAPMLLEATPGKRQRSGALDAVAAAASTTWSFLRGDDD
jgi:hypothetical protein